MGFAFWRRLDVLGHDACRLSRQPNGDWQIDGCAVFLDGLPAAIAYHVVCDSNWLVRRARVRGFRDILDVSADIEHLETGVWTINGSAVAGIDDCQDLDLGFTPATNLIPIRRLALAVGASADAPAAWFDLERASLERLEQRYERRRQTTYWYESPRFDYSATLEVGSEGFVLSYPGLWEEESGA